MRRVLHSAFVLQRGFLPQVSVNAKLLSFGAHSGYREGGSSRPRRLRNKNYMQDFLEDLSHDYQGKQSTKPLKPINKNIYVENETSIRRSEEAIEEIKSAGKIIVPAHAPKPIKHLKELQFGDEVNKELYSQFSMPTPIQSQSWPVILSGHDLIGISETGSGKTLGFMLPGLAHVQAQAVSRRQTIVDSLRVAPLALIVAPVRELARQINEVAVKYKEFFNVETALFYGGSGKEGQSVHFHRGFHLCVGTPGRLMDFIKHGNLDVSNVSFCVIDEADTMLSMGFYPQLQFIINQTRPDRQTLLWTATWPSEVRELAKSVTTKPIKIDIGSEDLRTKENITQEIIITGTHMQYSTLGDLFNKILESQNCKTLVFTNTRVRADRLTNIMHKNGLKVSSIHGLKSQTSREEALDHFRKGYIDFLVATDVASRGLDIQGIKNVVNVDFPSNIVQYIHRIGRTARGEKRGMAYSILTPNDAGVAKDLIKVLKDSKQELIMSTREELVTLAKYAEQGERYDDMVEYMKQVSLYSDKMEPEERNLLSVAYKNVVGSRRTALRILGSIKDKEEQRDPEGFKLQTVNEYRMRLEGELDIICSELLDQVLNESMLDKVTNVESRVFFLKMKGDYYRYMAEYREADSLMEVCENAKKCYSSAWLIAEKELSEDNPIRLGLVLNFSVFYYEIMKFPEEACKLAKSSIEDANTVDPTDNKDSKLILQLLSDNLTSWTANDPIADQ